MNSFNNNLNIYRAILNWKWHIVIILVVSVLLAALFSSPFFITPKFKSYAVLYPANITPYSEESETEQMLQLLQSRDIKDSVIKKMDLYDHYGIEETQKYYKSIMDYEFNQNVKIKKTPYESVEIEILDKDPDTAASMVNLIITYYNKKVRRLHNEKYAEVIKMYESLLDKKLARIDSFKLKLRDLGLEYGLTDYQVQAEEVYKGYLRTIMGSNKSNINISEIEKLKNNIEQMGNEWITTRRFLDNELTEYSVMHQEYEQAIRFYTDALTYANVVTEPHPADKKAYPVRWIIVAVTAFAALLITLIVILGVENYRNIRSKIASA